MTTKGLLLLILAGLAASSPVAGSAPSPTVNAPSQVLPSSMNTTTPLPTAVVGYMSGPNGRGTLSLLWSCLLTIFASTWSVLHLNVPGLHDSQLRGFSRRTNWMTLAILLPDFILSKAICELHQALLDLRDFDEAIQQYQGASWSSPLVSQQTGLQAVLY
jgi:hypothetical protein